jgi:hypothetical protein
MLPRFWGMKAGLLFGTEVKRIKLLTKVELEKKRRQAFPHGKTCLLLYCYDSLPPFVIGAMKIMSW